MVHSGYTLPVFAAAAAVAAIEHLTRKNSLAQVKIDLISPAEIVDIPVEQVALIDRDEALAITRSQPGDNLDITRNTPVWASVRKKASNQSQIIISGGEGIGKITQENNRAAIYRYAHSLLQHNLRPYLNPSETIEVKVILPEGEKLAQKTSNAAFGVVEGLSLLGTSGISLPSSTQGQLELYLQDLEAKAARFDSLAFCIGENGLNLAQKRGIEGDRLVKTANWLAPMLVRAGMLELNSILLFGYHGKLIKLAGGIFHTHHHLADGRLEILTAQGAKVGLPTEVLQQLFASPTTESALAFLRKCDRAAQTDWVGQIYTSLASAIEQKCQDYTFQYSGRQVMVGAVLFDRDRQIIIQSKNGAKLMANYLKL